MLLCVHVFSIQYQRLRTLEKENKVQIKNNTKTAETL